ncbi:hypothetical protein [Amycolatopsis sp. MEPSY49]|uniref:hypothetical protein n=1 Tax=Amycolatopsis sp. MEPSY49 TaxID=3151600 RepID=UPI003EF95A57
MRPTIVLLSNPVMRKEIEARLRGSGTYEEREVFDRLEVGNCWFGIDLSGDVMHDYDEGEQADLVERLGQIEPILVEYSSIACVRPLLQAVLDGLHGLLDTNFGELLEYEEVLANSLANRTGTGVRRVGGPGRCNDRRHPGDRFRRPGLSDRLPKNSAPTTSPAR